jgi:hypothetical protein
MYIDHIDSIDSENYFSSSQELYFLLNSLVFFEEAKILLNPNDNWEIQYCKEYKAHVLLHNSFKFNEKRAICALLDGTVYTSTHNRFIINSLRLAWAEYII